MTGAELETMLERDELAFLGAGSRRECHAIPGTSLCLKCYRDEASAPNATVAREIRRYRHDERRNACCREYRYWQKLKSALPPYVFAAFPGTMEQILLPNRGWAVMETSVQNADGTPCERFSLAYRAADDATKAKLLKEFWLLVGAFAAYAVRFYDTQNIVVQRLDNGRFRLRVVDFEPAARTLIPIDSLCPAIVRGKVIRRAKRYLASHCGVKAKYRGLSPRLRRKWDRLIATDGAELGLTDCRVFLENKLVNDIFYEGMFKGRPCVVKCSHIAPWSIGNEFRLLQCLWKIAPDVVVEPFAYHEGPMAFVVEEKLPGMTFKEFCLNPRIDCRPLADTTAKDFMSIANALKTTRIVHRDLGNLENYLLGENGHWKIIDLQFAVDRRFGVVDPWLKRNVRYHFLVLSGERWKYGACWNDVYYLHCTLKRYIPLTPQKQATLDALAAMIPKMSYRINFSWGDSFVLSLCKCSLKFKKVFSNCGTRRHKSYQWRLSRFQYKKYPYDIVETIARVSIIVPVYKVEPYLPQCIESLLHQSMNEVEVVLVDDGSPDGCPEICDHYADRDSRVKVIHKKNGGLSSARNVGLEHASAPYVMFCDGDDYLSKDACEKLYASATGNNADVACCGVDLVWESGDKTEKKWRKKLQRYFTLPNIESREVGEFEFSRLAVTVPTKLFKREILKTESIRFPEGYYHEDEVFHRLYMNVAKRIAYVNEKLYSYRQRPSSIMTSQDPDFRIRRDSDYFRGYAIVARRLTSRKRMRMLKTICEHRYKGLMKVYRDARQAQILEKAFRHTMRAFKVAGEGNEYV